MTLHLCMHYLLQWYLELRILRQ